MSHSPADKLVTQALEKWGLKTPLYIRKAKAADVFDVSVKTIGRWQGNKELGFNFPEEYDFYGITRFLFPELLKWGEKHSKLPMPTEEILRILGLV
jgi:hypothetical protein